MANGGKTKSSAPPAWRIRPRPGGAVASSSTRARSVPNAREQRQARADAAQNRGPKAGPVAPPTGPVSVESGVSVRDLSQALGVPMQKMIKSS